MSTSTNQYDKKAFDEWLQKSPLFRGKDEPLGYEFLGGRKLAYACVADIPGHVLYAFAPCTEAHGNKTWKSGTRLTITCECPDAQGKKLTNPQVQLVVEEFVLACDNFPTEVPGPEHEARVIAALDQTMAVSQRRAEQERAIFQRVTQLVVDALCQSAEPNS
jgi:hypothetical protein